MKQASLYRPQAGMSLIELMISILLGLIVMAGVLQIFGSTLKGNQYIIASARLNQELDGAMKVMTSELRRAGYSPAWTTFGWGGGGRTGGTVVNNHHFGALHIPALDCLLYGYDRNDNGTIDTSERNGFRLNDNGSISMRKSCDPDSETGAGAADNSSACYTDCASAGSWESITDPDVVEVTALRFEVQGSKCLNAATEDYWEEMGDNVTAFPCEDYTPTSPSIYSPAAVAPSPGDRMVEVRQVTITLEGQVKSDPTVRKETRAAVRVRNDRIFIE